MIRDETYRNGKPGLRGWESRRTGGDACGIRQSAPSAQPPTVDAPVRFTRRELEVLRCLTLGMTNRGIARALNISFDTAKEHVQRILWKIGAANRTQAAVWAVRTGLV